MADRNLWKRLSDAVAELPPIEKDAFIEIGRTGYKATTYDNVVQTIRPILVKHGIAIETRAIDVQHGTYEAGTDRDGNPRIGFVCHVIAEVTLVNVDNPAERIVSTAPGTGMDTQDKAPGKAFTYAIKYALRAPLMATTGENDEERPDHAPRSAPRSQGAPPHAQKKTASEAQIKMLNMKGKEAHGQDWEALKKSVLDAKGLSSTKDLDASQASKWIDQLMARLEGGG